ncbi:MAG: SDR family NAD(P)-dependent oxidoreductase [Acidimicrobiales bacterium]
MGSCEGKVALVTGAAVGLGRGFATALAQAGAEVAICDVKPGVHDVAAALASATGRRVESWVADVRVPEQVRGFVDEAAARFGGLDIVVANAGVWRPTNALTDPWDKALDDWSYLVDTNLRGVFLTGRAAIGHLVARGGGNLVNIATDHICPPAGFDTGGGTRMDVYDASKWGINGLTQAWAKLLRDRGVRVNALCMDATDSEMVRFASGDRATPEVIARWMTPAQLGGLLLDLLDEGPEGRTGENIGVWMGHPIVLPPRAEVLPRRHP